MAGDEEGEWALTFVQGGRSEAFLRLRARSLVGTGGKRNVH